MRITLSNKQVPLRPVVGVPLQNQAVSIKNIFLAFSMSCQVALKIWTAITTDSLGCQLSEHIELTSLLECFDLNRMF